MWALITLYLSAPVGSTEATLVPSPITNSGLIVSGDTLLDQTVLVSSYDFDNMVW